MTPADMATRYAIVTPPGVDPIGFVDVRTGEAVSGGLFVAACVAAGVEPHEVVRLCGRWPVRAAAKTQSES